MTRTFDPVAYEGVFNAALRMDAEQRAARRAAVGAEMARLAGFAKRTARQEDTLDGLIEERQALDSAVSMAGVVEAADLARIRSAAGRPGGRTSGGGGLRLERGTAPDPDKHEEHPMTTTGRARAAHGDIRGRALDLIDAAEATAPHLERASLDYLAEQVERDTSPRSGVAEWVLVAGDEAYRTAFGKLLRDPVAGAHEWTAEERTAFGRAQQYSRAMSLADAAGGYMVPLVLDPSIVVTGAGTSNANLRAVFTNRIIAGDVWNGVSGGTTAEWVAEAAEVTDKAPTLAQPPIPVHKWDVFVPYSVEVGEDALNFEAEMQRVMTDARDNLEATAFIVGTGSGQPTGIVTATLAVGGNIIATGTADTIVAADVFNLKAALPGRYRARAAFLANDDIYDRLRQVTTGVNPDSWITPVGDQSGVQRLLGKPMHESSEMDATFTATAGNDPILLYGDLSRYYVIDRAGGSRLELVPHLMGTNRRPTLQRGLILWGRTGGNLVDTAATRILRA